MTIRTISHRSELNRRFAKGHEAVVAEYYQVCQLVLIGRRYWRGFEGRVTRRKNGEVVVGAYRNIKDLGNLARGQEVRNVGNFKVQFVWTGSGKTPPIVVHEGATLKNGTRIPARRWTRVAAREARWGEAFVRGFQS